MNLRKGLATLGLVVSLFAGCSTYTPQPTITGRALDVYSEVTDVRKARKTLDYLVKSGKNIKTENYESLLNARKALEQVHKIIGGRKLTDGRCVDLGLEYLAVAESAKLPVYMFQVGDHVDVVWKTDMVELHWDTKSGSYLNPEHYMAGHKFTDEQIKNNGFMAPLSKEQVIGVVYNIVADEWMKKSKPAKALNAINKSIELDPQNPMAYVYKAIIEQKTGNVDRAIKDYRKSLEMYPTYQPALDNLGALLLWNENYSMASDIFARMLILDPNNGEAKTNLSKSLDGLKLKK